jgi:capsular polysaccharide biosynthesis protein
MDINNDNNYVREITLKELFFIVMHGWRNIIATALIFGIIFGSYKSLTGFRTLKDEATLKNLENSYQTSLSTYETNKTSLEKEIDNIKTSLDRQQEYNDKSILMQINPFNKQKASISFYVDTNYKIMPNLIYQNTDITNMVIRSYLSIAQDGELFNYILNHLSYDIERRYLKEIVTVTEDYDNHMIFVEVVHSDNELCKEIYSLVRECFEQAKDSINEIVGEHTLSVVAESSQAVVDFNLEQIQKTNLQTVTDLENALVEKQKSLEILKAPIKTTINNTTIIKSIIKFIILGGIIGIFFAMVLLTFIFIMSDKLTSGNEIRNRFKLKLLGVINYNNKKRIFNFIDKWLNSLEGVSNNNLNKEEALKLICANLKASINNENEKLKSNYNIVMTGTIKKEEIEKLTKDIYSNLAKDGYQIHCGENLCYSAETTEKIATCDAVIIIEKVGQSTYTEIVKMLANINDLEQKVIGSIIINS